MGRPHIYPEEFRREACELVRRGDRSQRQIAADLGIPDQTLNNWLKAESRAKVRAKDPNALTETELAELKRLRKENADLKTDREILYKGGSFFRQGDGPLSRYRFVSAHRNQYSVKHCAEPPRSPAAVTTPGPTSHRLVGVSKMPI